MKEAAASRCLWDRYGERRRDGAGPYGRAALATLLAASLIFHGLCRLASAPRRGEGLIFVSALDQRLTLLDGGAVVSSWPISTSKRGLGNEPDSYRTPLGRMVVARKIGAGAPPGMVFKSRKPTGEVLPPNAPGRDPVVTRILWLRGDDEKTRGVLARYVYIHGTPEEDRIGSPASYGCIRMRSADLIELFDRVEVGTPVLVCAGAGPGP